MRFSSRSTRHSLFACAAVLLAATALSGCEDKAIGRVCDLNVAGDGGISRSVAVVQPQALECPSRICVLPAVDPNKGEPDTAPFCTAECESDDDCSDFEKRGDQAGDRRCKSSFACGVANVVGQMCCRKMCLCRDFVTVPAGGIPFPETCKPGVANHEACPNVPSS